MSHIAFFNTFAGFGEVAAYTTNPILERTNPSLKATEIVVAVADIGEDYPLACPSPHPLSLRHT